MGKMLYNCFLVAFFFVILFAINGWNFNLLDAKWKKVIHEKLINYRIFQGTVYTYICIRRRITKRCFLHSILLGNESYWANKIKDCKFSFPLLFMLGRLALGTSQAFFLSVERRYIQPTFKVTRSLHSKSCTASFLWFQPLTQCCGAPLSTSRSITLKNDDRNIIMTNTLSAGPDQAQPSLLPGALPLKNQTHWQLFILFYVIWKL